MSKAKETDNKYDNIIIAKSCLITLAAFVALTAPIVLIYEAEASKDISKLNNFDTVEELIKHIETRSLYIHQKENEGEIIQIVDSKRRIEGFINIGLYPAMNDYPIFVYSSVVNEEDFLYVNAFFHQTTKGTYNNYEFIGLASYNLYKEHRTSLTDTNNSLIKIEGAKKVLSLTDQK